MAEAVTQQEFIGRKQLCDERDKRSSKRFCQIEEKLSEAALNIARSAEILNRISETQEDHEQRIRDIEKTGATTEQIEQTARDHEARLREIESKGGKWFDKIATAVAATIITALVGILIYGQVKP